MRNLQGSSQAPGRFTLGDATSAVIVCTGVNGRTSSARAACHERVRNFTGEWDKYFSAFTEANW